MVTNTPDLLTSLLTPWSGVLLEKLTGSQLVKTFPALYGTRRFITAITRAHHLPYPEPDQSSPCRPFHFLKVHLNTSSHLRLGLPSGPFPSGFPTKALYTPILSPTRAT